MPNKSFKRHLLPWRIILFTFIKICEITEHVKVKGGAIMGGKLTKDDLRQFGTILISEIQKLFREEQPQQDESIQPEWLKSKVVRKIMDMSPGSLQNLRVTGKVRYKKILGSYYYSRSDLMQLFNDNNESDGGG